MVVPSSGSLSLRKLANEKIDDDYNSAGTPTSVSLSNLATGTGYDATNTNSPSYPDGVTPHQMSEWYSYDHDALPSFQMSATGDTQFNACSLTPTTTTYYHDGVGAYPTTNDIIYTDSGGSNPLDGNNQWWHLNDDTIIQIADATGVVQNTGIC